MADRRVWAIILTCLLEPIDLKKMREFFSLLALDAGYNIFVLHGYVSHCIFFCSRTQSSISFEHSSLATEPRFVRLSNVTA